MESALLILAGGLVFALVILPGAALANFLDIRPSRQRGKRPLI